MISELAQVKGLRGFWQVDKCSLTRQCSSQRVPYSLNSLTVQKPLNAPHTHWWLLLCSKTFMHQASASRFIRLLDAIDSRFIWALYTNINASPDQLDENKTYNLIKNHKDMVWKKEIQKNKWDCIANEPITVGEDVSKKWWTVYHHFILLPSEDAQQDHSELFKGKAWLCECGLKTPETISRMKSGHVINDIVTFCFIGDYFLCSVALRAMRRRRRQLHHDLA